MNVILWLAGINVWFKQKTTISYSMVTTLEVLNWFCDDEYEENHLKKIQTVFYSWLHNRIICVRRIKRMRHEDKPRLKLNYAYMLYLKWLNYTRINYDVWKRLVKYSLLWLNIFLGKFLLLNNFKNTISY